MPFRQPLSFDEVSEALSYDPDTGIFAWKVRAGKGIFPGTEAGAIKATRTDKSGKQVSYRYIRLHDQTFPAARVAWLLHFGEWPVGKIHFEDGDTLNLRIKNLHVGNSLPESYDKKDPEQRRAYMRDHRAAYPISWKETELQRTFGIGVNEYLELAIAQGNKCGICAQPETEMRGDKVKALCVDHDHATGRVRGLLCSSCNQGIGKLGDNPATLRAAADYIERHATQAANVVPMKKEAT